MEHECNVFCKFFEVPTSYDQLQSLSSQVSHLFYTYFMFSDIGTTANAAPSAARLGTA